MKRKIILLSIFFIITIPLLIGVIGYVVITKDAKLDENKLTFTKNNLVILSNDGQMINNSPNNYVELSEISPHLITAFVSLEDKRFYEHKGVDYIRMIGASINNLKAGGLKEGASTITQQLIKNTHLSNEKTFKRKLSEIKLAKQLENKYSKDKIIEMYLNVIYFGSGVYGVKSASLKYFDKEPKNLSLNEACLLAGIVKNPKKYSPINNYDESIKRKNVVLKTMLDDGKIDDITLNKAKNENIVIKNGLINNNFARNYNLNVYTEASKLLNIDEKFLLTSNLKIATYLDIAEQKFLENLAKNTDYFAENYDKIMSNIDNETMGISSYYSSIESADSNISRQGGSALKPFNVYLPAIMNGNITPATQILDEEININGYSPKNYGDNYHGYASVRNSLAYSYNIPAVKILNDTGLDNTLNLYSMIGCDVLDSQKNLSLALGANNIAPLTLASTYSMLANGGQYKHATFIKAIYDENDKIIYHNNYNDKTPVCGDDDAYMMTDMLLSTSKYGTAKKLNYLNYDIASKTGTVQVGNTNTDAWCFAYTTRNTFMVWNGNRSNKPLPNNIMGGSYPTLIVKEMANHCYNISTPNSFEMPESVDRYVLDYDTLVNEHRLELSNIFSTNIITEIFKKSAPPLEKKELIPLSALSNLVIVNDNGQLLISFDCTPNSSVKIYKHEFFGKKLIYDKQNSDTVLLSYNFNNSKSRKISIVINDKVVYTNNFND